MKSENEMKPVIHLKLFATLRKFQPASKGGYPITPSVKVRDLIRELGIPEKDAKLVFINSVRCDFDSELRGGERVGIFPPVGGG